VGGDDGVDVELNWNVEEESVVPFELLGFGRMVNEG